MVGQFSLPKSIRDRSGRKDVENVGWKTKAVEGIADVVAPAAKPAIKAYHGSPHHFDKFEWSDRTKGTGEGAQMFGDGLYFAEKEEVGKTYRDTLSKSHRFDNTYFVDGKPVAKNELTRAQQLAMMAADDPAKADAIRQVKPSDHWSQADIDEAVELATAGRVSLRPPGAMYEVNINADPDRFIDWDAPLRDQPQMLDKFSNQYGPETTGYRLYQSLSRDPDAAKIFREAGIPGIKYRDAHSRDATENPSRNYVVWDDSIIEIVKKYGIAGALGAGLISQDQAEAAQAQGMGDPVTTPKTDRLPQSPENYNQSRNFATGDAYTPPASPGEIGWDIMQSIPSGARTGIEAVAGLPGTIINAQDALGEAMAQRIGFNPMLAAHMLKGYVPNGEMIGQGTDWLAGQLPQGASQALQDWTRHKPTTPWGQGYGKVAEETADPTNYLPLAALGKLWKLF
jgi:hypothetical protein